MLGASRAGAQKLLAESRAGAVDAYAGGRSRQAMLLGEIPQTLLAKIDRAESLGVFRLQAIEYANKTGAGFFLEIGRQLGGAFELAAKRFKGSFLGRVPPVGVDDRVAEQAVEPGGNRLARLEIVAVLEGAQISCLENVFSQCEIRHAPLDEGEKLLSLREELIEWRFGHG